MRQLEFTASREEAELRLDQFLARMETGLSRTALQALIENGSVLCNGRQTNKKQKVKAGDCVCLCIPEARSATVEAQDIPLEIVYEDEWLLVVNKPKGMVVHPAPGNPDGTLVNALMHHCGSSLSGIGGEIRPGIVHRIDKDTSGLLVVAKDDRTHQALSEQMSVHSIHRLYHAVVYGGMQEEDGFVEAPIGRHKTDRKKMAITEQNGRYAYTGWRVMEHLGRFTYIECKLRTGRTHQIRVHMASIGHPLAGDTVYGPKNAIRFLHGQCLHAKTLGFVHPATGEYVEFTSPLPEYFEGFLGKLRKGEQF